MDMGQFNHESGSLFCSEIEADEEFWAKDNADFQEQREKYKT